MSGICRLCDRTEARPYAATCTRCMDDLGDTLAEIGRLHARLDPTPGSTGAPERGAPGFRSQSPARDDVIVLTDDASKAGPDGPAGVRTILLGWWEVAADAGEAPTSRSDATVDEAVSTLAADAVLDSITRHGWVSDLAEECRSLLRKLRAVCGETDRRIVIGECPREVPSTQTAHSVQMCGGKIRALVFGETARCGSCGATWRGKLELRGLSTQLGEALADAPAIARYLGVETSTVRTWAQRDGWTRHLQGKRRLYSLAEARSSWERRKARSHA